MCQAFVGRVLEADREQFADALAWFAASIPPPRSALERETSRLQLRDCAHRAAALFHRSHYARFESRWCSWRETGWDEILWANGADDVRRVLDDWTARFLAAFDATHTRPLGPRVAALVHRGIPGPLDLHALSRETGASGRAIRRAFKAHYGIAVREFHRRALLRWAARELRQPDAKVDAIAAIGGYSSRSGFHAALETYGHSTPASVRSLTDDQFAQWLETALALPKACRQRSKWSPPQ